MPKSANHNTIIFVRRRHSIAICIVANVVISIRKEEVVDENVEKQRTKKGALGHAC